MGGLVSKVAGGITGALSGGGAGALGGILGATSGGPTIPGAPDLSGNVKNANDTFKTATSNAQQTFNTAQNYNTGAQKTLADIVGKTTPVMDQVNQAAGQNLNTYSSNFVPLQAQQAEEAANYTAQNTDRNRGMAVADQASAAEAARKNAIDRLQSEGVDPASIQGGALDRQAAIQAAAGAAGAGTQSVLNTENTGRQLVQQANQLGLQVGQQGTGDAATGAQIGSSVVGNTNSTNTAGIQNLQGANGALGLAVDANKSGAGIASDAFGNQMKAYDAQQAQADAKNNGIAGALGAGGGGGIGSLIGAAAPLMSFLSEGGKVSEHGALPVSPVLGSTDRKPAMLTPGEHVIPEDVASWKGHEFFHKLVAKERMRMKQGIPAPTPPPSQAPAQTAATGG